MALNFFDRAEERDDTVIKGLCQAARTTRMELREWVQTELHASLEQGDFEEQAEYGEIRVRIKQAVERLRVINHRDLPQALTYYDDVINDVANGGFEDVHDAYDKLNQGCVGLIRIMKELLEIRGFIGEM